MCIISNTSLKPKIAEEDIVCYKVLVISSVDDTLFTPFQNMNVELNKEYFEPNFIESLNKVIMEHHDIVKVNPYKPYCYNEYMFHTFKNKDDAMYFKNCIEYRNSTVIKAIIPKGSKYIEGIFSYSSYYTYIEVESFGSEKIIYKPLD